MIQTPISRQKLHNCLYLCQAATYSQIIRCSASLGALSHVLAYFANAVPHAVTMYWAIGSGVEEEHAVALVKAVRGADIRIVFVLGRGVSQTELSGCVLGGNSRDFETYPTE